VGSQGGWRIRGEGQNGFKKWGRVKSREGGSEYTMERE